MIVTICYLCNEHIGMNKTLDEVIYQDGHIHDLILQSFQEIEFIGLAGIAKFGSTGVGSATIEILQQQGNNIFFYLIIKPINL